MVPQHSEARRHFRRSAALLREISDPLLYPLCLEGMAGIAVAGHHLAVLSAWGAAAHAEGYRAVLAAIVPQAHGAARPTVRGQPPATLLDAI